MFGSVEDQIVDDTKKIPAWHSNRLANHLIRRVSHTHYFSDIMLLVCLLQRSSHLSSYNQQSSFLNYRSICDVRHLVYHLVYYYMTSVECFLVEHDLLGGHVETNYIRSGGLYSYLQELEVLNIYINAYNIEIDQARKSKLKRFMVETQYWSPESNKVKQFRAFLKAIENKVHEFLLKSD
jgi:hypothetical protein